MNKLVYILAIVWVFILPSCSPNELPDNVIEEPEYSLEGTLDGQIFSLDVGPDNVFINSHSDTAEDEVPTFTIEINGEECEDCLGSLEFVISGEQSYHQGLEFSDFISEGNYNVISPFITSGANPLQLSYDYSDYGDIQIGNESFNNQESFNLSTGQHQLNAMLIDFDSASTFSYLSNFEVDELGTTCFEQSQITFENGLFTIQIPEDQAQYVQSILVTETPLEYTPGMTIDPLDFMFSVDSFELFFIVLEYSTENGCIHSEQFSWSSQDEELNFINYSAIHISNVELESIVNPLTLSLVYTNPENVVYVSTSLEQNWFEIIDIQLAADENENIFNITFSCTIELINEENPQDVISLHLENAVIPLVF